MPTPFSGMDPYVERGNLWPNVHSSLIVALRDELAPRLRPRYYVAVEERSVRLGIDDVAFAVRPDLAVVQSSSTQFSFQAITQEASNVVTVELPMSDEVRETYLAIYDLSNERVVTVVEVLSPTNKTNGLGRRQYEQKRLELLGTLTHLVEIDLLRGGPPMPMRGSVVPSDYRILVSRAERRPQADLLPFSIRQPIPTLRFPLQAGDDEPEVDLNHLVHALYDRAGYDLRIDYKNEPEPPLVGDDTRWAEALLHTAGLR